MAIKSRDLFYDTLQGPDGLGISVPNTTAENYYDDSMYIFTANAKNINRSQNIDISKPFYGYTLNDSTLINGEELAKKGFNLNAMAYTQIQNESSIINVRIPYIHNIVLPLPDDFGSQSEYEFAVKSHTLCTLDPTNFLPNYPVRKNTLVKVQFLDQSLRTAVIIGLAGAAFGGFTAFIQQPTLTIVGGGSGPTPSAGVQGYVNNPGKSIIVGDSTKVSIYYAARKAITKYGGSKDDINLSYGRVGGTIPMFAKDPYHALYWPGIQTGADYKLVDRMDKNGNPFASFYNRLQRVVQDPNEIAKYSGFINVFFGTGANDMYALSKSVSKKEAAENGPFNVNSENIINIPRNIEMMKMIFTNPNVKFYIFKGSAGFSVDGSTTILSEVRNPVVTEYYRRFYINAFPEMNFLLFKEQCDNKVEGFPYSHHPDEKNPSVRKMGDLVARITAGATINQAEDFEDFSDTSKRYIKGMPNYGAPQ